MLPLEVIKKYYPNATEEELKEIQEAVYLLGCAVMQHFYGEDWEKDIVDLNSENEEDWSDNLIMSSNLVRVLSYRFNFNEFSTRLWG